MLVLRRRINQAISIGHNVRLVVLGFEDGHVRLGFDAPSNIVIDREEISIAKLSDRARKKNILSLKKPTNREKP